MDAQEESAAIFRIYDLLAPFDEDARCRILLCASIYADVIHPRVGAGLLKQSLLKVVERRT